MKCQTAIYLGTNNNLCLVEHRKDVCNPPELPDEAFRHAGLHRGDAAIAMVDPSMGNSPTAPRCHRGQVPCALKGA